MYDPKVLANVYKRNLWVLERQLDGLSHADSLLQPEARGNCMNYVLGHILVSRDAVFRLLGLSQMLSPEEYARYDSDVEGIIEDSGDVIRLEKLKTLLTQSTEDLQVAIEQLTDDELEKEIKPGESSTTLGQRLEFFGWHETYHIGQTEYLRQLAGTDDKVI